MTAFVLRENTLWNSKDDLNESNAVLISVGIPPTALAPTLQPVQAPAEKPFLALLLLVGFIALIPLFLSLWVFRKK